MMHILDYDAYTLNRNITGSVNIQIRPNQKRLARLNVNVTGARYVELKALVGVHVGGSPDIVYELYRGNQLLARGREELNGNANVGFGLSNLVHVDRSPGRGNQNYFLTVRKTDSQGKVVGPITFTATVFG